MVRRRIGNDIDIEWSVYRGEQKESFTGKTIKVHIIEKGGKKQTIKDNLITISDNTVSFTWKATNQYSIGNYSLVLELFSGNELHNTVDIADAIELVPNTALEEGDSDYIADTSVAFRSDFNVVFSSIDKAYAAAASAKEQALATDVKTTELKTATFSANEVYNKLKKLLEEELEGGTGSGGDSFFSEDNTNNVYLKTKTDGSKRDLYNINKFKSDVLVIPNGEGVEGEWYLEVGKLGQGVETPEGGAGNISNLSIKIGASYFNINEVEENVIVLPEYPTLPNLDKYATIEWVRDNYALSSEVYNKTTIDTRFTEYLGLFSGYLKTEGGTITNDLFVRGKLSMGTLVIPNAEGVEGEWTLEVGALGEGADTPSAGGGSADSVDWSAILNKPTTLSGYGITDALPLSGGTITGDLSLNQYLRINAWSGYGSGSANVWYNGTTQRLLWENVEDMAFGSKLVLHSGNYSDYALPKSGGTISNSNWGSQLTLNGDGTDAGLKFTNSGNFRGILYTNKDGRLGWYDMSGADHTLIHSGNIGSQSVNYATSAGYSDRLVSPYSYEGGTYINNDTTSESLFGSSYTFSAMMENCAAFNGWANVLNFSGYQQFGGTQLAVHYNNTTPRMALRNFSQESSKFSEWREIAFLDSNVASATKLQTPRTIWGQSFDGTGNVDGDLDMRYSKITFAESANDYHIGWGSDNMFVYKNYYGHYFITNDTERMRIAGNGNVLIGTTTDDVEARLLVEGSILGRSTSYSSTIIPSISGLRVGTRGAGHNGYNTGIAFNALNYPPYHNHIHAWIGLGSYTTTAIAECYPLIFATNDSTTINTPPTERMRILPNGNVLIGTADDSGAKVTITVPYRDSFPSLGSLGSGSDLALQFGTYYGLYFSVNAYNGSAMIQNGCNDGTTYTYPILLNPFGGNVGIGTAEDRGGKLQVVSKEDLFKAIVIRNSWYDGGGSGSIKISRLGFESPVSDRGGVIDVGIKSDYGNFDYMAFGWNDGSSTTATEIMRLNVYGAVVYGNISADGIEIPQAPPSNPQSGKWYLYIG